MENDTASDTVTTGNPLIDYSAIPGPAVLPTEEWEAPPRKYFGKKMANGKLEPEKPYTFVPYPSVRYAQPGGKGTQIVTKMVNSKEEDDRLGKDWSSTPATFGYIGAPSAEELLRLNGSPVQAMLDAQAEKDAIALEARQKADKEAAEASRKAQAEADEAKLQERIAAAVTAALAARDATEKRGPGRPPKQD